MLVCVLVHHTGINSMSLKRTIALEWPIITCSLPCETIQLAAAY